MMQESNFSTEAINGDLIIIQASYPVNGRDLFIRLPLAIFCLEQGKG